MKPNCFVPDIKVFLHEQFLNFKNNKGNSLINIELSLTGKCNANCPFCFYGEGKDCEDIDYDKLSDFLDKLYLIGVKAITITGGGEPTLYKKFNYIVEKMKKIGFSIGIFTNALKDPAYDASLFDWIRISKTDKDWNYKNIKKIAEVNNTKVGMCINYIGENDIKSIQSALNIANEFDNIKYVQVRPALNIGGKITEIDKPDVSAFNNSKKLFITDYKFEDCKLKYRGYKKCYGYHFAPFIWHNGDIGSCGYQKDLVFGNIYKDSLEDILGNFPNFINVRKDCQICCRNDKLNKSINNALKIEDVNFA